VWEMEGLVCRIIIFETRWNCSQVHAPATLSFGNKKAFWIVMRLDVLRSADVGNKRKICGLLEVGPAVSPLTLLDIPTYVYNRFLSKLYWRIPKVWTKLILHKISKVWTRLILHRIPKVWTKLILHKIPKVWTKFILHKVTKAWTKFILHKITKV
jgi:hypothetical protein